MDVAAVRPDELAGPPARQRRTVVAAVLVLLLLLAVAAWLGWRNHDSQQRLDAGASLVSQEQAVLTAARGEAVALTSISYRTASSDLDRILAGATGALAKQFAGERSRLPQLLGGHKSESAGSVLSSGLTSLSADSARAVVAVDARVSGSGDPKGVLKHYRMVMTLSRAGARWLVSDVAFAGVPQ